MRCDSCPVPAALSCRGEAIPHQCNSPRYRAYFVNLATGRDDPIPPRRGGRQAVSAPHLRCPHARPLTRARSCRDVWCEARGFVACRASDCTTCPIPAGRLLAAPPPPPAR